MEKIVVLMIATVFLEMIYFIFEERIKAVLVIIYAIIVSESGIYYSLSLAEFLIALGPSISAVAVVGMFIPIKDVTVMIVMVVFFSGLTATLFGAFVKRILKKGR